MAVDNDTRERILQRDGRRCTVGRLLGGDCHPTLHIHHIVPRADGGTDDVDNLATVCAAHHPTWESLRAWLERKRQPRTWKRCTRHRHPYPQGREQCERRLNQAA